MALIGMIGVLLPLLVFIGNLISSGLQPLRYSISHYHGTGIGSDIFVGLLFALGFCLFLYEGYVLTDKISAKIAGIFALGVAIFPTGTENILFNNLHYVFISLLFIVFAFFSIFLFTKSSSGKMTRLKLIRNKIYRACGIIMLICITAISVSTFLIPELNKKYHFVFWFETLMFNSFGISWIVKSQRFILKDKYLY